MSLLNLPRFSWKSRTPRTRNSVVYYGGEFCPPVSQGRPNRLLSEMQGLDLWEVFTGSRPIRNASFHLGEKNAPLNGGSNA